ncbi:hypothetical protein SmJEL517_g00627 [Synchytrium microbalum]|uniref:Protein kinase domain-containing protein n=1 Tax=Synchytrium microbalum TaxID=1806994 RepID=A0A507CIQ1_9FUNG|nr:uncharacterized protein SmJEL517_g00627 [Synchytrium microbalum]TPX37553.1 hypothetical protein SmJEL517_g00627 [Synchytrium microbalum]
MGKCASKFNDEGSRGPLSIKDFSISTTCGTGAFGKVSLVERRGPHGARRKYALKCINKERSIADKAAIHIIQERNLLEELRHSNIIKLCFSFQDSENMYMVLDLMPGGDLRFHLKKPFSEDATRIIVAEISSALDYLHARRIVHRDVKPDNVLLDAQGHAVLTDFNIAVRLRNDKPLKSIAGTEPYMAPELLEGCYYTSVDWWSLGVMMYELLFADRPFRGKDKRNLIRKGEYRLPIDTTVVISPECESCLAGFLQIDISKRLGHEESGMRALMSHPFFSTISSWRDASIKQLEPCFVPSSTRPNFEVISDVDPVKALVEKKKIGAVQLASDLSLIEKAFKYYNSEIPTPKQHSEATITETRLQSTCKCDSKIGSEMTLLSKPDNAEKLVITPKAIQASAMMDIDEDLNIRDQVMLLKAANLMASVGVPANKIDATMFDLDRRQLLY